MRYLRLFDATPAANNRRSFLQKLGIGVSSALGASTVLAVPGATQPAKDSDVQVATLQIERALHALLQRYEQAMDAGDYTTVLTLFSQDAEVHFNGGVYRGREQGLPRLYTQYFAAGKSGKRMQAAPGYASEPATEAEQLKLAPDLQSATARVPYSIQLGEPIHTDNSLASMARLHGEGVRSWWEAGSYEIRYAKQPSGEWLITQLVYNTSKRADYRAGRSEVRPLAAAPFSQCYPANAVGPDLLLA
jgi:SnoaL-like domain